MKRTRKKTTKWNVFFHFTFILLMFFSGVVLVPLYLKYIPVRIYGFWLAIGNILTWLTALDPGIGGLLQQKVSKAYGELNNRLIVSYVNAGFILSVALCLLVMLVGISILPLIEKLFELPKGALGEEIKLSFLLSLLGNVFMLLAYAFISVNQGLQSSIGNGLIQVTSTIISIGISVFLLQNNFGLYSLAISPLITGLGLILGNSIYLFKRFKTERINYFFDTSELKNMLKLLRFTFLGKFGSMVSSNVDMIIVARFIGPESVALLNISKKGPELGRVVIERPVIAILPSISHLTGSQDIEKKKKILNKLLNLMIWNLGLVVSGFIALNDSFVRLWVGDKMFVGTLISFFICLNVLVSSFISNLSNLCYSLGVIKSNGIITFYQSLLTLLFTFCGAYFYGMIGLVVAPVISNLLLSISFYPKTFFKVLKYNSAEIMSFKIEVVKTLLSLSLVSYIFGLLKIASWLEFVVVVFTLVLSYLFCLFFISIKFRTEFYSVISEIKSFLN